MKKSETHSYLPNDTGVHARARSNLISPRRSRKECGRLSPHLEENPVQAKTLLPVACNALLAGVATVGLVLGDVVLTEWMEVVGRVERLHVAKNF